MQIAPSNELVPPPLIEANVRYPHALAITLSGLGIDACSIATVERLGPQGCPPDSFMGEGIAVADFPVKHEVFREAARIAVVRTNEQEGHLAMLLCLYDEPRVSVQMVLVGELLPAPRPYGGILRIRVPLIESWPGAPDVAVGDIQLVLGPKNLTYYERVHNRNIAYKPSDIPLGGHCPRGGFPFAVQLKFLGGALARNRTAVACPKGSPGSH
jgi:hypothetical protein